MRRDFAVSQVIGFLLSFVIASSLLVTAIFFTTTLVSERLERSAEIQATEILNRVVDAVVEAAYVKQTYPNADYCKTLDIPTSIGGHQYYIEFTDDKIYLNFTTMHSSINVSTYKLGILNVGLSGKVYSSSGKVKIYCNRSRYLYKFDFGTVTSPKYMREPFTRVGDSCSNTNPPWPTQYDAFKYRVPIFLINPNTDPQYSTVYDFQVRIQLDPSTIDYDKINSNGSDLRFYDPTSGTELPYWIEVWKYGGRSFVWVKVPEISHDTGRLIYMYYGNKKAQPKSNGSQVFLLFDDFNSKDTTKWAFKNGNAKVEDGFLVFNGESAVVSKTFTVPDECIVSALVYSVGNTTREGSIFVRCQDQLQYYNSGYMLSSGNLSDPSRNLAIIRDNATVIANSSSNSPMLSGVVYKLVFAVWNDTYFGMRLVYDDASQDFILDGDSYAACIDTTYTGGYLGLCAANDGDFVTKFDWIIVYKAINQSISYTLGGEDSKFFWWDDVSVLYARYNSNGGALYGDSVFSNISLNPSRSPTTLYLKLPDTYLSTFDMLYKWSFEEDFSGSADGRYAYEDAGSDPIEIHGAQWVEGKFGTALYFDGSDDYAKTVSTITMPRNVTFVAWIKPYFDYNDGLNHEWLYWSAGGTYMHAYKHSNGETCFVINGLNSWQGVHAVIPFSSGDFHLFVGVYNALNDTLLMYWDGELIGTASGSGPLSTSAGYLYVGSAGSSRFFHGIIDEVRIYQRALSGDEIREYYNKASHRIYSVSFAVGDEDRDIDNEWINSSYLQRGKKIDTLSGEYKRGWFYVEVDDGILDITFYDSDSGDDFYWNICMLTVEEGIRGVKGEGR